MTMGTGPVEPVLSEIRELDAVNRADGVAGAFDIIVEVEAESEQAMLLFVTDQIRSLDKVGRIRTCIVREQYQGVRR